MGQLWQVKGRLAAVGCSTRVAVWGGMAWHGLQDPITRCRQHLGRGLQRIPSSGLWASVQE